MPIYGSPFISRVLSLTIQIFLGNPDLQLDLVNIPKAEAKGEICLIKCRHLNVIIYMVTLYPMCPERRNRYHLIYVEDEINYVSGSTWWTSRATD